MTNLEYKVEVDKRGGRKAVARALGLSVSVVDRRCSGETARIKPEAERSLLGLPVREDWKALKRLKEDPGYRSRFRAQVGALPERDPAKARGAALLAEAEACLPGNRNFGKEAAKGGRAKAAAMRKAAKTKGNGG